MLTRVRHAWVICGRMNLGMNISIARGYDSRSQIARVVSEDWAGRNLYCPACDSRRIRATPPNTKAVDFECPKCASRFQLKSGATWNERRIPDAGYDAMMQAISSDAVPNLYVLQYGDDWAVRNLLLVPSFFFTASAIERRMPLRPTARRAGWVGCNILLGAIAEEGKIRVVSEGAVLSAAAVRRRFERIRPLEGLSAKVRGWTLDVLCVVRAMRRQFFTLRDVYAYESRLSELHPGNQNVRPKIRQQLQVLRDLGLIRFLSRGHYEMIS